MTPDNIFPVRNDDARIASVRRLQLLDTPPQARFDRITSAASRLLNSSIALISLVDRDRQWFLSRIGIDACETGRDVSFCNHAIASEELLCVEDALLDERFCNNPLVLAGPQIRSYLGQPIKGPDGALVGTLCVADQRSKQFDGKSVEALQLMGQIVEDLLASHCQEIDLRKASEDLERGHSQLQRSNRIFLQAEKAARIGAWEVNLDAGELTWSRGVYDMHAVPPGETVTVEHAISFYVPEDRPHVAALVQRAIDEREPFTFEANIEHSDGTVRRVRSRGEYLEASGAEPARLVGIVRDITESYHARAALERAATYDSLTDLLNRHAFDRLLGERLANHQGEAGSLGVMLVDLDGFKAINDTFGHLVGDTVLEEIASRIARSLPEGTVAARWGGDEFAIIAPDGSTTQQIRQIAGHLLGAIKGTFEISGRRLAVGATCGAAIANQAVSARELVRRADLALYHGKERDPGTIHFYEPTLEKANDEKQKAILAVRDALDEQRVFAGYQPIVDLRSNRLVGLEALMRLTTPNGRELTATSVLPAILDPVLSREIGEAMIGFVASDFGEIAAAQSHLEYVSFNATEADLLSHDFSAKVLQVLARANVDARRVALEVTETMLMVNDNETVQKVLTELSDAGVTIALDDFGTGFSSLSHLRDFPIDIVKIDGSFVQSICSSHQSRLIVQALIAMADNLKIKVVAEGIEREEQRALLLNMGCRYGQGFLLGSAQTACRFKLARYGNRAFNSRQDRSAA